MPMVLCGQDLLLDHLMANAVRSLTSRVLWRNHLEAIKMEFMQDYLNHPTKLAGSTNRFFSDEAIFAIHQRSGRLLRRANSLAKTALMACAMEGSQIISAEHVRAASTEFL